MVQLLEADDLVPELKVVRESGLARADLNQLPSLRVALTARFPEVDHKYLKARLRELLVEGAQRLEADPPREPSHKRGAEIAFGLSRDFDALGSRERRRGFAEYYKLSEETVRRANGREDQVLAMLAREIVVGLPQSQADAASVARAAKRIGLRDDLLGGRFAADQFRVSRSPAAYRDLIGELEASATRIDSFPKRLSVVFKSDRAINQIATQRFGRGSAMIEPYVEEHMLRRKTFHGNLARGAVVREIYAADDLREYLLHGHHGKGVDLDRDDLAESIAMWQECMQAYPENYLVAFTAERIPFKYEVVDSRAVVMHEAISGNDRDRLNAFAIVNDEVATAFARDFELVWERTPAADRSLERVMSFIAHLQNAERSS